MAVTITLPQIGESVVEGVIGKWLKQPGERVAKYDPLVEVVTDKVTVEVPSPVAGVLSRILAQEGATVPVGTPIAEMESAETPAPAPAYQPPTPLRQETPSPSIGTTGVLLKDVKAVGPTGGGVVEEEAPPRQEPEERQRYSPAVRRLAQEHGVDLSRVPGTGLGGRVTKEDVLRFVEERGRAAAAPTPQAPHRPVAPAAAAADEEVMALSPVRRIIAENMVRSASQIPHAWTMVEADVTNLVRFRESVKEDFHRREGVELTYLPFVVKAVAEALKENPLLNSTWGGDKIILKKRINIGIAVAAPDGLVVPVIHDADRLSISGLARALRDLTLRARQGKLTLQDMQGGTFTLNNTGALGSVVSYPIINYPQAAILTTEAIQKRPVVIGEGIAIRSIMNLCLSFDHRVSDGAEAAKFIQAVRRRLEAMGPDTPLY